MVPWCWTIATSTSVFDWTTLSRSARSTSFLQTVGCLAPGRRCRLRADFVCPAARRRVFSDELPHYGRLPRPVPHLPLCGGGHAVQAGAHHQGAPARPPARRPPRAATRQRGSARAQIRADIPDKNYASGVTVSFVVPRSTTSAATQLGMGSSGQSAEYSDRDKQVVWQIKKFTGGACDCRGCRCGCCSLTKQVRAASHRASNEGDADAEHALRADGQEGDWAHQVSPCLLELAPSPSPHPPARALPLCPSSSMSFELPMYNVSNLQVRYLRIAEQAKSYKPYRWVRYVTQSNSYVCRL